MFFGFWFLLFLLIILGHNFKMSDSFLENLWMRGGYDFITGLKRIRAQRNNEFQNGDFIDAWTGDPSDAPELVAFLQDPQLHRFILEVYPRVIAVRRAEQLFEEKKKQEKQLQRQAEIQRIAGLTQEQRLEELQELSISTLREMLPLMRRPGGKARKPEIIRLIQAREKYFDEPERPTPLSGDRARTTN